jgi:hypothetical protein
VRTLDQDGVEVGQFAVSGGQLLAAHTQGGFLTQYGDVITRHAPPPGHQPWSYEASDIRNVVQSDSGIVYVVTGLNVDAVDGDTGQLMHRETLPLGRNIDLSVDNDFGRVSEGQVWPMLGEAFVDADDTFRLPFATWDQTYDYYSDPSTVYLQGSIRLLTMAGTTATYVDIQTGAFRPYDQPFALPGSEGAAVTYRIGTPDDHTDWRAWVEGTTVSSRSIEPSEAPFAQALVGDAQRVFKLTPTGLIATSLVDGSTIWTSTLMASPVEALSGGRVAALANDGTLYTVDESGTATATGVLNLTNPHLTFGGHWIGTDATLTETVEVEGSGERTNFGFMTVNAKGTAKFFGKPNNQCKDYPTPFLENWWKNAPPAARGHPQRLQTLEQSQREAGMEHEHRLEPEPRAEHEI